MTNGRPAVESVDRALLLIMHMRDEGALSITDAAARLGVSPSTVHRILSGLIYRGFAAQGPDRLYRIGPELYSLSSEVFSPQDIRRHSQTAIKELQHITDETVQIITMSGGSVQLVDGIEPRQVLRIGLPLGDKVPAFVTSGGKAMLARLSDPEIDELYIAGLPFHQ